MVERQFPSISVLIPTKNGGQTIAEVLASLTIQSVNLNEVIIADSASDDSTVDIAKSYDATVVHIDPKSFDHGGTRTFLCNLSQSEILVFLTQDAILKKRDSIEKLITPLIQDEKVATCYGRQLPSHDANHFAQSLREFNYPSDAAIYAYADRQSSGIKTIFTSNSFACYRKEALAEIGFFQNGLIFGEDTVAVGRLLQNNYKNAYVADALVYHSHNNTLNDEFKRYFDIGVLHTQEKWLLEKYGNTVGQSKKYLLHELKCIRKKVKYSLLPELFLRITLKYCGYRIGRYYKSLPKKIILACSLHKNWWLKYS